MKTEELIENYLNEQYADEEIKFIVYGAYVKAMHKDDCDESGPVIKATMHMPLIAELTDAYKKNIHAFWIDPIIRNIHKQLKETKI